MSLLAEELVEEWLNRQGYFTIRGLKIGVHEMDILAIRYTPNGIERRHIEVQASVNPVSYITKVPKGIQKETGRKAGSAKIRDDEELRQGVHEWIEKKFDHPEKQKLLQCLAPGIWTRELVLHKVKHKEEKDIFLKEGITLHELSDIVAKLKSKDNFIIEGSSGTHLVDLINISK